MAKPVQIADFSKAISDDMLAHVNAVSDEIRVQFLLQGHSLTGKAVNSLETQNQNLKEKSVLIIDYALKVNSGISAAEVRGYLSNPFKRQEYLNGLTKWVQRRNGGSLQAAKGIAVRIAKVAARTGHPTPGARRFSKNGKRTGFIEDAVNNVGEITQFKSFEKLITTLPGV